MRNGLFIIDTEHGGFDYSDLSGILMTAKLCGLESIVRLPDNGRREITRIMDMGATGILIPMTNDESQIKKRWNTPNMRPSAKEEFPPCARIRFIVPDRLKNI
ncbi:MAG: hypothetical protein ACLR06_12210 [Christensenellaceae bacterium]